MAALSLCIVPNSTLKSVVWECFGFSGTEDGTIANRTVAICRICNTEILLKNNTMNLFTQTPTITKMSLRRSASESTSVKQSKQSTLHESVNALQPLSTSLLLLITHFHIAIQQHIASILCTVSNMANLPYGYSYIGHPTLHVNTQAWTTSPQIFVFLNSSQCPCLCLCVHRTVVTRHARCGAMSIDISCYELCGAAQASPKIPTTHTAWQLFISMSKFIARTHPVMNIARLFITSHTLGCLEFPFL